MEKVIVYYTDSNLNELGVLNQEYIDLDIADTMDFTLEFPIKSRKNLKKNYMWFIDNTEYAGIIDKKEVVTNDGIIRYSGRNLRGILASKIVEPPKGDDYLILNGNISNILNNILSELGLNMFKFSYNDSSTRKYIVPRYITLYDLILRLCYECEKVLSIKYHNKKVYLDMNSRIDYTDYMIQSQSSVNFNITQSLNNINHLICLGQGELKNRDVIHLYMSNSGKVTQISQHAGLSDYSQVYENTQAKDKKELLSLGTKKLKELNNLDAVDATLLPGKVEYKIGDIIGGYEDITDIYVRREITNIILQICNGMLQCTYKIGGEDTDASAVPYEEDDFYILPIATELILGGIKVGNTLEIDDTSGILTAQEIVDLMPQLNTLYKLSM